MLYFAAFKEHYLLFAASGTPFKALEDELRTYELRKATVQFPGSGRSSAESRSYVRLGSPPRKKKCSWAERKGQVAVDAKLTRGVRASTV